MEILIDHYRLGMKLSMPVVVGDKTLLDSGASIDSEKMLERVINNGVTKIDVHKSHIRELSEKYPEFYQRHKEKVSQAKEAGQARRAQVAKDWAHCRSLVRRPPSITILAKPMHLPDTSKWLSPFFPIEHSSSSFREIADSIGRSKMIVIRLKDFGEEELDYIRTELKKGPQSIPVLAVVDSFYHGPWETVRWGSDGSAIFRAAFVGVFPEHEKSFPEGGVVAYHTESLKRPTCHFISRESSLKEADEFFDKWPGIDVRVSHVEEAKPSQEHLTIFRCPNGDQSLLKDVKKLFDNGHDLRRMMIFVDEVNKDEVGILSKMGKLKLQLGNLQHQTLEDFLAQLLPPTS